MLRPTLVLILPYSCLGHRVPPFAGYASEGMAAWTTIQYCNRRHCGARRVAHLCCGGWELPY
jgi:hypothetical protein